MEFGLVGVEFGTMWCALFLIIIIVVVVVLDNRYSLSSHCGKVGSTIDGFRDSTLRVYAGSSNEKTSGIIICYFYYCFQGEVI